MKIKKTQIKTVALEDMVTEVLETFIRNFLKFSENPNCEEVLKVSLQLKNWYCLKSEKEKYDLSSKLIDIIKKD
jgi:hypothetical protein